MDANRPSFKTDSCFLSLFNNAYELPSSIRMDEALTSLLDGDELQYDFFALIKALTERLCSIGDKLRSLSKMSVKSPLFFQGPLPNDYDAPYKFFQNLKSDLQCNNFAVAEDLFQYFEHRAMHIILFDNVQLQRVEAVLNLLRCINDCAKHCMVKVINDSLFPSIM